MTGHRFGRLVAVRKMGDRWLCQCDCGQRATVDLRQLRSGKTRSCGCIRTERIQAMEEERLRGRQIHQQMRHEGTRISRIASTKVSKASSTGVRGVSRLPSGKYRAYLNLRGRQLHLGYFASLEEAADAREVGEREHYQPVIEEWIHGQE